MGELLTIHVVEQNNHFIIELVDKLCFDHIVAVYHLKQIIFFLNALGFVSNRLQWRSFHHIYLFIVSVLYQINYAVSILIQWFPQYSKF